MKTNNDSLYYFEQRLKMKNIVSPFIGIGKLLKLTILFTISIVCTGISQNLLNNPESVVFDSLRNRYLVSNWGDGAIVQIDSNGEQSYFNTDYLNQYQIAGLYVHNDTLLGAAGNAPNSGVIGFNIETGQQLFHVILPNVGLPNDIVVDKNGIIYVTDYWGSKLYKIDHHIPSVLIDQGLANPNGMIIDSTNNRLLILSVVPNSKILAVDLSDTMITTVYTTTFSGMDGITVDSDKNVYVSEWGGDAVHKFAGGFSSGLSLFSSGHTDPADIYFDKVNNILAVPNFSSNSVDFIPIPLANITNRDIYQPRKMELKQNYPNPFNPATTINYFLPKTSLVQLKVFNSLGQEIITLVNKLQDSGSKSVKWNGTDNSGKIVSSGVYIYQLQTKYTDKAVQYKKMLLIR